jgi:hypothetical protein
MRNTKWNCEHHSCMRLRQPRFRGHQDIVWTMIQGTVITCGFFFFRVHGCIENFEIFLVALSIVLLALLLILHSMVYDIPDISMYVIKCISWVVHICWQVSFKQAFNVGKISDYPPGYRGLGHVDVQCFPLYSYLLALNRTKVDYFSLDVEGSELDILRNIPFEKLDIRVCDLFIFAFFSLCMHILM